MVHQLSDNSPLVGIRKIDARMQKRFLTIIYKGLLLSNQQKMLFNQLLCQLYNGLVGR
jgi:hypothetical protein